MQGRFGVRARAAAALVLLLTATGSARADAGPTGGALPPQLVQVIQAAGAHGVPADAAMVAANVTAINPVEPGYLTVYSCDEQQPTASNVNYVANQIAPNLVLSRVAADGTICVATSAVTDVFVDLVGYVPAGSSLTPLAAPVRALDTRGPGGDQPLVPAGGVLEIPIAGQHGVAPDATVVMFNATAVAGDEAGYLTAYPCGTPPTTSSVNYLPRQVVPNLLTARLSATGSVCISTLSPAHVIVDVAAFATDGIETLVTPQRVLDTRSTTGLLPAGTTTSIDIAGRTDVPDDATAAVYNLTSVDATAPGYATSYPCDAAAPPEASNLNYGPGQIVANGSITKLSTSGALCIFSLAPTNLIVDLVGYTTGATHYVPVNPVRVTDTRAGWERSCDWVTRLRGGQGGSTVLYAFNLTTGQVLQVPMPGEINPINNPSLLPIVTRDCTGVWVVYQDLDLGEATLWRFGFDGSASSSVVPLGLGSYEGDLQELPDGRLVLLRGGSVRDVRTGEFVATNVTPTVVRAGNQEYYLTAGSISRDGRTIAAVFVRDRVSIVQVYTFSGQRISSTALDGNLDRVSLSPDGTYLAVDTFGGYDLDGFPGDDFEITRILTRFGDVVDLAYGEDITLHTEFLGRGTLATCVGGLGLFTWDLFGAITMVADSSHPFFADDSTWCVTFSA